MKPFDSHRWGWCLAPCLALLLSGCAASRFHAEAMRLIDSGDRDAGLELLAQANQEEPTNSRYKVDLLTTRAAYARELLQRADEARRTGKLDAAAELYAKAAKVEPANDRGPRGLAALDLDRRHVARLTEADRLSREGRLDDAQERVNGVLADNPGNVNAQRLRAQLREQAEKQEQARAAQIASQSVLRKPVTLQFRDANLRMVFEALSRATGLNVIMDRDVRADLKTTIFVKDATLEDTVDLILMQSQLEKRSLNANTLFIYPATAAKQKEYQDLQVHTFQLANADAKYLLSVLKTVLKIKEVSVDDRTNTLVMRDTRDAIAVAAKIIKAHDVPEPEVMLEVEVLEVSRDRLSNLGIKFPDSLEISTPSAANTIGALRDLTRNDLLASPLGIGVNLKLQDTDAQLLASPRIRARHKEKARILIGDRVPIITNSVTPVQSGGSVVTGSVQYQDVGLKLEFEPQIYSADEVGIRISLEVSNIVKEIAGAQGSLAYQIGTRNAQTVLRLRDGETQILAGLIADGDRNTAAKLPGVGHLPVVGKLFGNNTGNSTKTEIVLSITPRIIRAPVVLDATLRDVFSGTENGLREKALRLDPISVLRSQSSGGASAAPGAPQVDGAKASPGGSTAPAGAAGSGSASGGTTASGTPGTNVASGDTPAGTAQRPPDSGSPPPSAQPGPLPPQGPLPPSIKPGAIFKPAAPSAPAMPPAERLPKPDGESAQAPKASMLTAASAAPPEREAAAQTSASTAAVASAELNWRGPASTKVGDNISVALDSSALPRLKGLPLVVRYDPLVLRFVGADLGELAQLAGATDATPHADASTGRLDIALRFGKPERLSGSGALINLTFAAKTARAQTRLVAAQIDIKGEDGRLLIVPRAQPHLLKVTQ